MSTEELDTPVEKPRRKRTWRNSSPEEREAHRQDDEAAKRGVLPPKRNDKKLHEL